MKSTLAFLADVRDELKKINWPSRKHTTRMTTIVIIATVGMSVYVGAIDFALTKALEQLLLL